MLFIRGLWHQERRVEAQVPTRIILFRIFDSLFCVCVWPGSDKYLIYYQKLLNIANFSHSR